MSVFKRVGSNPIFRYLQQHPELQRTEEEIKQLDAKNVITDDYVISYSDS